MIRCPMIAENIPPALPVSEHLCKAISDMLETAWKAG
ncbi:hypothetical protein C7967_11384 [Thalassospira sp. 11-3]|nr:hypothetical protein KO164_4255 [Thalassospira sp. KO164]PXX27094.1 hypothetical protein C7967_11384 [Thalassospira sp. 11-3]SEE88075.1 hypothetical protein SAMN04515623_4315 [Thalassospira permensis]